MSDIIISGGGGHAKVVISILKKINQYNIIGYSSLSNEGNILGVKYLGKDDFSPFVGGGVGLHWVSYCSGSSACMDDIPHDHRRSGINLNAQAGYVLFRTYNVNVIARGKYHLILNSDLDQGFTLDVALERKPTPKRSADESKLLLQQYRTYYIIGALILSLMGAGS